MASLFNVIRPIGALILAGYLRRRTGILGPSAASESNRLVARLCLYLLGLQAGGGSAGGVRL